MLAVRRSARTARIPLAPLTTPLRPLYTTRTMAANKRIFAPGTDPTGAPSQAAQYLRGTLDRADLLASPLAQFHAWFTSAQTSGVYQPETVNLATASPAGVSSRMVYLKELDGRGFVVYTNLGSSRKAADISATGRAALCFWWREAERQVRVEGAVERVSGATAQAYFDTRARGSRVGAWASAQSAVLRGGRAELEGRVGEAEARFAGAERIPVPEFWGGLRVVPERVEFWQGRESRLHDRFVYTRVAGEAGDAEEEGEARRLADEVPEEGRVWKIERLSP